MKHTPESLAGLSNAEVNKALAELLGKKIEQHSIVGIGLQWCVVDENNDLHRIKDYCNNPSDVMPLVFEHGISLIKVIDGYVAIKYDCYIDIGCHEDVQGICADGLQFGHSNPLRAAACCLILVLQEKQK